MVQFLECLPSMDKPWVYPQYHINWVWLHTCNPSTEELKSKVLLLGSVSGASLGYMRYCL